MRAVACVHQPPHAFLQEALGCGQMRPLGRRRVLVLETPRPHTDPSYGQSFELVLRSEVGADRYL